MRLFLKLLVLTVVLAASPVLAAEDDAQQAIAEARAALDRADAAGYEWRDSETILKMSEEAAAHGDAERAKTLAGIARFQGEAALAQSKREANAEPRI